jgi:hypothetical protein
VALASCGPKHPSAKTSATALTPVDNAQWREVPAGKKRASLAFMCAGNLPALEAAEPSLKNRVSMQVPWDIQVTKHGKLQAQCVWSGPDQRLGRMVIDVKCLDDDNDDCSRFAYAEEGGRRINAVTMPHRPPPPISHAYPPGRDDAERAQSNLILAWARDNAPTQMDALRVEFRGAKIGIEEDAKVPVLCGEVREQGAHWHRFAVFSTGPMPSPVFHWIREPEDDGVKDFCDVKQGNLQWYAVPEEKLGQ